MWSEREEHSEMGAGKGCGEQNIPIAVTACTFIDVHALKLSYNRSKRIDGIREPVQSGILNLESFRIDKCSKN